MKIYFITRFSIFDPNFKGFRIVVSKSSEEYERELFSTDRMEFKFHVFQNVTIPSIIDQTNKNWEWHIFTSDRLPNIYMTRLKELARKHFGIYIFSVKNFKEFFEVTSNYNYISPFATVRIDDDDALNLAFVEMLQKYSKETGKIISFTEGRLAKYEKGKLHVGKRISEKNNAQGLAGIGINIYACGRHTDIDTRYKVIYDNSPDMFLLMCSDYTDTKRGFTFIERTRSRLQYIQAQIKRNPLAAFNLLEIRLKKIFKRIGLLI